MSKPTLFRMIDLSWCQALMLENWNAAPGRFFVGYRTSGNFSALLGQGVVDEFRTISGPLLLAPADSIGGVYDAGMRLADARDVEAPIDQGWPPLTIGIDTRSPARPDDWQEQLLDALKTEQSIGAPPWSNEFSSAGTDDYLVESSRCVNDGDIAANILVTDAPMLPIQLERLAEVGNAAVSVAVSVGNRLPRVSGGEMHQVDVVSEAQLDAIIRAVTSPD